MTDRINVAIVGLGSRGKDCYAKVAEKYPEDMKIVAIADPNRDRLEEVAKHYQIPEEQCFTTAELLLDKERMADAIIIATQDRQHVAQAKVALEKGYHILLEKPISPDPVECRELELAAKKSDRKVVVCHVLRYTPFFMKVKEVIDSGKLGDVVTIMGIENVGYFHQAHSFVRGNWANSEETSPMILAKCCHDLDLYIWLTGKTPKSLSSFGNTFLFKKEKAPAGATKRCLEGCKVKEDCPYDAQKIYLDGEYGVRSGVTTWPVSVLAQVPTEESILEALRTGPYGRCVYYCDNNVVDHQVVNIEMTDGALINFTMGAFTATISRYCKIMGTMGELIGCMDSNTITVTAFGQEPEVIDVGELAVDLSGHAGGDVVMVKDFLDAIKEGGVMKDNMSTLEVSMDSHYLAFAAEESRINGGKVIQLKDFKNF